MFSLLWLYDDGVYVLTLKFLIIIILFDQLIIRLPFISITFISYTIINNNNNKLYILKCLRIIIK